MSTSVNSSSVSSKAGARSILKSRGDWRTLIIAVLVYSGWFASVFTHKQLPWWATFALLTWFGAWHLSLQHELVHGHPFRNSKLNAALASLSVTMWVPFLSFKRDHISHHNTTLTHPQLDTESYYAMPEKWQTSGLFFRAIYWANRTLAFRLTVWSVFSAVQYFLADAWRAVRNVGNARAAWMLHIPALVAIVFIVTNLAGMSMVEYLIGGVFGSHSLNMMRSFAEHKTLDNESTRTAMIDAGWLMGILMLNNNLHIAHHDEPSAPWYEVPAVAKRTGAYERAEKINSLYSGGYFELVRRFTFKPYDQPVYSKSV
jgi:fatty acid desaturase